MSQLNAAGFPNTYDADSTSPARSDRAIAPEENAAPDGSNAGPSSGSFRLAGKRLFFTWPRCTISAEDALKRCMDWRPLERCMVARELHVDGTPHLHALLWCRSRVDLRTFRSLDAILGQHGNYQVMKDPVKSVQYLMKGDDYVSFGFDPKEYVAAAKQKRPRTNAGLAGWNAALTAVQKGGSFADLEDQAFVARNLRKLMAYADWWSTQHPKHRVGTDWAVRTVVLWGDTGVGKSYWARRGGHGLDGGVFVLPYQRDGGVWWDGYRGERVLLLDDFDPKKMPLLQLLRVLDSYEYTGMVKGSVVRADWLEVIITNNAHPSTWYPKASYERMRALKRRLKICWVGSTDFRTFKFDELYEDTTWPEDEVPRATSANYVSQ